MGRGPPAPHSTLPAPPRHRATSASAHHFLDLKSFFAPPAAPPLGALGAAPALPLAWALPPALGAVFFAACLALASFAAASLACCRTSGFCAFFFLISSAMSFLCMRRQARVQRSFMGLMRWW